MSYKYKDTKINDDLVCEVTEFLDKYIKFEKRNAWFKTYLYNDLSIYADTVCANDTAHQVLYMIPFRVPGATRGGILLSKLNDTQYRIETIEFIGETCCSEQFGCYNDSLVYDAKQLNGKIRDFKNVKLNGVEL